MGLKLRISSVRTLYRQVDSLDENSGATNLGFKRRGFQKSEIGLVLIEKYTENGTRDIVMEWQ